MGHPTRKGQIAKRWRALPHLSVERRDAKVGHPAEVPAESGGIFQRIGIGGRVASPPLPHHRTSGSAYGGSIG